MSDIAWDSTLYDTHFKFIPTIGEELITMLVPQAGEQVIDLGCGTGHLTQKIASYGVSVLGIDSSPEMIDQARRNYPDLLFTVANGETFQVDEPYDAVFSNAALHWMKDAEAVIARIYAAIKPGGRLVAEMGGRGNVSRLLDALEQSFVAAGCAFSHPWYFPSIGEYATLLEKQGFRVTYAAHFDRSSLVEGENGLSNWLAMFAGSILKDLPPETREAIMQNTEKRAKPFLYREDGWAMDYVRLRIVAVKEG